MLKVEARGMATKLISLPTAAERKTITVSDGALIRGRLMNHGKPVPGVEIGLIARDRGGYAADLKIIGNPYEEIRIGTQEDGTFVVTNVPPRATDRKWMPATSRSIPAIASAEKSRSATAPPWPTGCG